MFFEHPYFVGTGVVTSNFEPESEFFVRPFPGVIKYLL